MCGEALAGLFMRERQLLSRSTAPTDTTTVADWRSHGRDSAEHFCFVCLAVGAASQIGRAGEHAVSPP